MKFVSYSQPIATNEEIERLLLEVFSSALLAARDAGCVDSLTGEIDWRQGMAVDLLERWGLDFEEMYRRYREGPPA